MLLTLYRAAISSSVSVVATLTISPETGGMRSVWPLRMSALDLRPFAHTRLIVETLYFAAIETSVSPALT